MNKLILLFLSIILISSCRKEKEEIIGKWDDIIKLSTKNVELKKTTDSVLITTEGTWWWIFGINLNDSTYSYYNNENINITIAFYIIELHSF